MVENRNIFYPLRYSLPITPKEDVKLSETKTKPPKKRGTVNVLEDRCKGCWYCVEYCPTKVLQVSDKLNEKGYHPPVLVEEEPVKVCIACHMCELVCPDFAIVVEELK